MGRQAPPGLTFDSGALIAVEAADRKLDVLLRRARELGRRIVVPAGVLAQTWRGAKGRQARLALFIDSSNVTIEDLNRPRARAVGELCARSRTRDIVDASVVVAAWANGRTVVTSDPGDILRLDGGLTVIPI